MKAKTQACWLDLQRDKSSVIWKAASARAGKGDAYGIRRNVVRSCDYEGTKGHG